MDWGQIAALFLANASLILWMRSESRSDWRAMDAKMDSWKAECNSNLKAIHEEMRDFHGRLCAIEERRKRD